MSPPNDLSERQEFTQAITELRDHVQLLWHAIDELREAFEYAVCNRDDVLSPLIRNRRITSMPRDPTAPDFAERVNAVAAEDLSADEDGTAPPDEDQAANGRQQRELFNRDDPPISVD